LGTLSLKDLREAGVEPVALVSYMARLGASLPVEVVTDLGGIADAFDLGQFGMAPTKFSAEDLQGHSSKTLRAMSYSDVADRMADLDIPEPEQFWQVIGPNLDRFDEITDWLDLIQNGTEPVVDPDDAEFVAKAMQMLPAKPWTETTWSEWTAAVKAETGRKGRGLFMPLRKALTGRSHGPDMGALLPMLKAVQ